MILILLISCNGWSANLYRVDDGVNTVVNEHSICRQVDNGSGSDIMVPTKTGLEWLSFRSNLPTGVSLSSCPITPPSAITDLSVGGRSSSSILLNWTAPADNGTPLVDYRIEYKETSSGTWLIFSDGTNTLTSVEVTGLLASTSYDFRVFALNGEESASSNVVTDETAPNDPFFDPAVFNALNNGGATRSQVVTFLDNTTLTYDGATTSGSPLNAGDTEAFNTAIYKVISSDKPFYIAGRRQGGGTGNTQVGHITWNVPDWAGKNFVVMGSRSAPHIITVYAFEDSTINIVRGVTPVVTNDVVTANNFATYSLPNNAGYLMTSTGVITAYQYSEGGGDRVEDNMPVIPPANQIIGIPSRTGQYTTSAATATGVAWYESNGTNNTGITLNQGVYSSYGGNGAQYGSPSARVIASEPIVGRSNADNDGNDGSPFVPKSFQKRMFGITHLSEWVSFVSTSPATIREFLTSGVVNTFTLSRTGSNANTPYFGRRTNVPAGTIYESDLPFQAYYETDDGAESSNEREDETLMFGWSGYPELPVSFKLKLWLDASDSATLFQTDGCTGVVSSNNDPVGCWRDKTLHTNNALQAGGNKPTWQSGVQSFAGRPGVNFNGGTNFLNLSSINLASRRYTIFAALHRDTTGTNEYFFGNQSATTNHGLHLGFSTDTGARLGQVGNNLTATTGTQAENSSGIFYARLNGSGKKVYFNNDSNTDAVATQLISSGSVVLGRGFDANGFDGQIAELLVYDRALNDAEISLVVNYLNEKWFRPTLFGNIKLWLDAASSGTLFSNTACTTPVTGTGQNVHCWTDKSGSGAKAIRSGATNPIYTIDAAQDVVQFTNDGLQISGTPNGAVFSNGANLDQVDIFAMMKSASSAENGFLFTHPAGNDLAAQIPNASSQASFSLDAGASGTISAAWGANTTNYFLWNFISDDPGSYQAIYRDRTLVTSDTTTSTLAIGTENFFIGSQNGSTNFQNMNIIDLIVYSGRLSSEERHSIRAYLMNKFAN